jgi:hypothetical protein
VYQNEAGMSGVIGNGDPLDCKMSPRPGLDGS